MDDHYSRAVLSVFVDLFAKGHIYRGKRMVNWCPVSQTALSDEEVIMKPANGTLYRVLFLSAVILFLLTFVLNTLADVIRQRLRKKFGQL